MTLFPPARVGIAILLIFATGVLAGFFWFSVMDKKEHGSLSPAPRPVRQIGRYTFINPLLECDVAEGGIDARKENFRDELAEYLERQKAEHGLSEAAVYFRDLNNGPAFGVNEEGEFFPASLLKVPVMMTYFHWAESEHDLLSRLVPFETPAKLAVTPTIISREQIVLGEVYTVEELIRRMIVYSDNQALLLLSRRLPAGMMEDLFAMIGAKDDVLRDAGGKLTAKEYAGFFRILFNSSYLSREYSEKALAFLAETDYSDALPAKLPQDTRIAHKFGEAGAGSAERQLHDCGIVYFPDHPYLVCIMTRGKNTDDLKRAISGISEFIYHKIDEQY